MVHTLFQTIIYLLVKRRREQKYKTLFYAGKFLSLFFFVFFPLCFTSGHYILSLHWSCKLQFLGNNYTSLQWFLTRQQLALFRISLSLLGCQILQTAGVCYTYPPYYMIFFFYQCSLLMWEKKSGKKKSKNTLSLILENCNLHCWTDQTKRQQYLFICSPYEVPKTTVEVFSALHGNSFVLDSIWVKAEKKTRNINICSA